MSVLGGNPLLLGSAAGSPTDPTFPVQRSVRLRSSASAYFNRTLGSGSTTAWTWSGWFKRGYLGANQVTLFFGDSSGTNYAGIYFTNDNLNFINRPPAAQNALLTTTQVFRDPSAWYHVVCVWNSANATSTDRVQLYVNGNRITTFSSATYPPQNAASVINTNIAHEIGSTNAASSGVNYLFDGYLTEVNFIDGQALTPTSFGGYNSGTGVWEPRAYTGTYGTNGFYLKFTDNSAATATTIGKDSSGNSNNWTPNNISVTVGVTYDSMLDVPTLTSNTNANFCTLNPLITSALISNANLTTSSNGSMSGVCGTMSLLNGKYYFELSPTSIGTSSHYGIIQQSPSAAQLSTSANSESVAYRNDGNIYRNTGSGFVLNQTVASFTTTDLMAAAVDTINLTVQFYKNNTAVGTPVSLTSGVEYTPWIVFGSTACVTSINFGQRPFTYTPPSGFKSLNTYNLPEPTIPSGDDYHKVYTYTGNGGGLQVGEIQKPASLFNLDRSLRLRSSASANLSRTPASAGSLTTWTWSGWVKPSTTTGFPTLFSVDIAPNDQNFHYFYFANGALEFIYYTTSTIARRTTTQLFRDPAIWYHLVFVWDTTNATASNRMRIYVNGVQQTLFSSSTDPSLNLAGIINSTNLHTNGSINYNGSQTQFFDGYLADVYFIDGQALAATDFGTYDGNFYWTPKAYTGTYGTNGFHLEFEDNSAATAAAIGKDTSGNVNNWTPNNISVTAGNTYDSMTDVPTQTSTSTANFAVINPLTTISFPVTNGNLSIGASTAANRCSKSSIAVSSGKWYWELRASAMSASGQIVGVCSADAVFNGGTVSSGFEVGYYSNNGNKYINGTASAYGSSWGTPQTIGVALDIDGGTVTFYRDNVSQGAIPIQGGQTWVADWTGQNVGDSVNFTFGQRPFDFTPPAGFKVLNSFNIAEVTGDLETPDFVWIKSRSATTGHALFNSVSGVGKYLSSNTTTAETTDVNSLIQFNKNGFLLGNAAIVNTSAATYVASAWKAGATTVTNTDGSISAQVRANQIAGFSIVTYTGTGANATVGHGLGVAPKMVIIKTRSNVTNWVVWQTALSGLQYLNLELTNAVGSGATVWNSAIPTSTVINLGTDVAVNGSGRTNVAYCFAEIAGFSKFGSYTGNGSADGPFVHLGFRPRFLLLKNASLAGSNWIIEDSSRQTANVMGLDIQPNVADAEVNNNAQLDFLSNGFKLRATTAGKNGSGNTIIYAAFAENPFKYALAR